MLFVCANRPTDNPYNADSEFESAPPYDPFPDALRVTATAQTVRPIATPTPTTLCHLQLHLSCRLQANPLPEPLPRLHR